MAEERTSSGAGGVLGANNLQRAIDSFDRSVQNLQTIVGKMGAVTESYSRGKTTTGSWNKFSNWAVGGGTNGGGATFNGQPAGGGGSNGGGTPNGGSSGGSHRADGPPETTGGSGGDHRGSGNGAAKVAFVAGTMANSVSSLRNGITQSKGDKNQDSSVMLTTAGMMNNGRAMTGGQMEGMYRSNWWAMSASDAAGAQLTGWQNSGSSGQQGSFMQSVRQMARANPTMSAGAASQVATSMYSMQGMATLHRVGIETVGKGGSRRSMTNIASQILNEVDPHQTVVAPQDAQVLVNDPGSDLNLTLSNWVANGIISGDEVQPLKDQVMMILKGRQHGLSAKQVGKASGSKSKTSSGLKSMGIGNTFMQNQKDLRSAKQDDVANGLEGFSVAAGDSTEALTKFKDMLNAITDKTGISELTSWWRGNNVNKAGGLGRGLGMLQGLGGLFGMGGNSEQRMSVLSGGGGGGGGGSMVSGTPHNAGMASSGGLAIGGGGGGRVTTGSSGGQHLAWPTKAHGPITAHFGQGGSHWSSGAHTGIDIGVGTGTPVHASANGTVNLAGSYGSYGNAVKISHGGGIETLYGHNSKVVVRNGQQVRQGQLIAYSGATGNVTGPHVHFEVRKNGHPVNPMNYLGGGSTVPGTSAGGSSAGGISAGSGSSGSSLGTADAGSSGLGSGASYSGGGGGGISGIGASELSILAGGAGSAGGGGGDSSDPGMSGPGGSSAGGVGISPGGSGQVRTATLNTHTSNVSAAGAEHDLSQVMGQSDVISLQEYYYKGKAKPIEGWLGKHGWGLYKGPTGTSVTWNKSKYDGSNAGAYDLNVKYKMPKGISQRYATYVLLTDKETGAKFWQVSAHMIPNAARAHVSKSTRDAMWNEQMTRLRSLEGRLSKSAPVIIGGDFNDKRNMSGMSHDSTNIIDNIFGSSGTRNLSSSIISTKGLNTDHNALLSTLAIGAASGRSGGGSASGGVSGLSGNKAAVNRVAASMGWGRGSEWSALVNLVNSESGFRNTAQNPTSTAYGMFQFLDSTWRGYGKKTSDPNLQAQYGLKYIKNRYGDPIKAWNFHKSHNWYDKGAWSLPNDEVAQVHKDEMIIPAAPARQIREILVNGNPYGAKSKGGGSGVTLEFKENSIQVIVKGGDTGSSTGHAIGKGLVDALATDQRIRNLQSGAVK